MRFAYIDSQGNEVAIPSVDALALRIELGAIKPDTELYDAQADRWGPARSHEIFHTLSRAADDEPFVVPPPPVAPPPPPPAEPVSPTHTAEEASLEALPPDPEEDLLQSDSAGTSADQLGEPSTDANEYSFDLVDAGGSAAPPAEVDPNPEPELSAGFEGAGALELEQVAGSEASAGADDGTTDLSGGLEFEGSLAGDLAEVEASDAGGLMGVETEMDFMGDASASGDLAEGLDLEEPLSDFSPDSPPAWMEQDATRTAAADESVMDFSAPSAEPAAAAGVASPRDRREPRSRPSPPRPIKRRSGPGPLVAVIVVLLVGAGGYYGWQMLGSGGQNQSTRPPVVIPQIPPELVPQMQELAAAAIGETFSEVDMRTADDQAPSEPREEWLAGVYLANASQFSDVEVFWANISRFSETIRETETTIFHDKYRERAESAELEGPVVDQLTERADSGFVATRGERLREYALLNALAQAALELHAFLVANEASIAYTPATGLTGNPVEEAVPNSQELSDEMWSLVERLTNAQDALLGTLDRVNRDLLLGTVRERIEQIGII